MTKSKMATSIISCVAKPGFTAVEHLQQLSFGSGDSDAEDATPTSFLEAVEIAKEVEKAYDAITEAELLAIHVFCREGLTAAQEYEMAEFVTTLYTASIKDCKNACLRNVYCTSFAFSKEDMYPTHTNNIMNYTGIYTYEYWPCQLYMFGTGAAFDISGWSNWDGTEVRLWAPASFPFRSSDV